MTPFKITLIAKGGDNAGYNALKQEAFKQKIHLEVTDISDLNKPSNLKKFGDVIIWRSAKIDIGADRTALLTMLRNRIIINEALITKPFAAYKLYQQKVFYKFGRNKEINYIPTYTFKTIDSLMGNVTSRLPFSKKRKLRYPFIMKPSLSSKGNNVFLIKSRKDVERGLKESGKAINKMVFQNFIQNDGDFRVFVMGGKALGVMKRVGAKGSYLNNISKGGSAHMLEDESLFKTLTLNAVKLASLFDLTMCGVDFIQDKNTGKIYFLEINTAPQWNGFQSLTKINMAEKILNMAVELHKQKSTKAKELPNLIRNYYDNNYEYLAHKQVHYAERMYLWTKDIKYYKWLLEHKSDYLGKDSSDIKSKLEKYLKTRLYLDEEDAKTTAKELRLPYLKKYPKLNGYIKALFKVLFAETIYKEDIRPILWQIAKKEEMIALAKQLEKDSEAITILSTKAINFFYLLEFCIKNRNEWSANPELYLKIATEHSSTESRAHLKLKNYLLTHAIIGQSYFYFRPITEHLDTYRGMLKLIEENIFDNYFDTTLDNKFEFLLCSRIVGEKSKIENLILNEAKLSLSKKGNYLIDRLNNSEVLLGDNMYSSEHRNVLFIMANTPQK